MPETSSSRVLLLSTKTYILNKKQDISIFFAVYKMFVIILKKIYFCLNLKSFKFLTVKDLSQYFQLCRHNHCKFL
jgi:hypothetical protein